MTSKHDIFVFRLKAVILNMSSLSLSMMKVTDFLLNTMHIHTKFFINFSAYMESQKSIHGSL